MNNQNLYHEGKETYSLVQIIIENLIIVLHIAMGIWAMWDIKVFSLPIVSIIYFIFLSFMLIFFLRKHLCTHCYYYGKTCHCGWSKLSMIFKKNSGDLQISKKAAPITWGVLMIFPIIATTVLLIINFKQIRLLHITILIILFVVQSIIHKKDCADCKMKYSCPGSVDSSH